MTRAFVAAAIACAALLFGAPAGAAVDLDTVAEALRSNPLYNDPQAERTLSEPEVEEVQRAIRGAGTPIYVAVLPASAADAAGGDPAEVARQLASDVARPGTYAVVVGGSLRAGSTELPAGRAGALAQEALAANGGDTAAVLVDFVDRVADSAAGDAGGSGASGGSGDGGGQEGGGTGLLLPVLLLGGAGAGVLMWRKGKRRRAEVAEQQRAEEADRQMLRAELSVLADDVVQLETEVQLKPEARHDFDAAVTRYRAAQAALEYADEPLDLVRVARVVAEARYSMDRARAILAGREPPPPPDELRHTGPHGEPAVTLDEERQPAYVGYPGGYESGWFGGVGGSLFSGLLLGSMLGGGFGFWGHGGTTIINQGGDGGGGDFGGGDFGGDFGGGDFGGGDFGGGDF